MGNPIQTDFIEYPDPKPGNRIAAFEQPTARAALQNLYTGETFEFQFNPPEFSESLQANYSRLAVPGLGFQVLQYINSNNLILPFEIYMTETPLGERDEAKQFNVIDARNFLQSLIYPIESNFGGWIAPPLVYFVWPEVIAGKFVVNRVDFNHQKFRQNSLKTCAATASIELEAVNALQIFSDNVRNRGKINLGNPPPVQYHYMGVGK
jgi:hypothetical protein